MKFRGLLTAAVLLAVLAGAVYWSNRKHNAALKKDPLDTSIKFVNVPEDQVREIHLVHPDGSSVVLVRQDKSWRLTAPASAAADQDAATGVATALATLTADTLVEENNPNLHNFGLDNPAVKADLLLKDGKTRTVLIGADAPAASGTYAKLQNDAKVYTVSTTAKASFDKSFNDLRDKRLLTFDPEKLSRVGLTANNQSIEFGKNAQGDWQIVAPKPMRADGQQVDELVRRLKDARMVTDADAKNLTPQFASAKRVATAQATDSSATQTLEVRKDAAGKYYAKSSAVEGVYSVADDIGKGLDKKLEDFRNKKVFDFGFNDPVKLATPSITVEKKNEKWFSNGKEMDAGAVQSLIDKLRDLAATGFSVETSSAPALDLTVVSGDGKRVEKAGIFQQNGKVFAKREGDNTAYDLDANALASLQNALAAIKPVAPSAKK